MGKHLARQSRDLKGSSLQLRRGWFWFLAGALVAFVMAFSVRTLLSPLQIRYWVEQALIDKSLPIQVEFAEVRLEFSRGFFPWLGVVVKDVFVLSEKPCEFLSELKVDHVAMPLSLVGLFKKQIYVSHLYLGQAQLRLRSSRCEQEDKIQERAQRKAPPSPRASSTKGGQFPITQEKVDQALSTYRRFWENLNKNITYRLSEVLVKNLEVLDGHWPGLQLDLGSLHWYPRVEDGKALWTLRSRVSLRGDWMEGEEVTDLQAKLDLAEKFSQLTLKGNYKEGELDWLVRYDWKNNWLRLKMKQQQLPLSPILQILKEKKAVISDTDTHPLFIWLNCHVSYGGSVVNLGKMPIRLEPCSLQGDLGEVTFFKWRWYPWRESIFSPFEVRMKELDLQKLVLMMNRTGPSGILSRFGKVFGVFTFDNPNKMAFVGELRDAEVFFSNRQTRGKQLVPRAKGELRLEGDRVTGFLSEIELDKGDFAGSLSFNLDRGFREGVFQVAVDRLTLHPSFQELMVGGEVSALSVYGRGKVSNGHLTTWLGNFGLKEVSGDGWKLLDVKLSTNMKDELFKLQAKAGSLQLSSSGDYYRLVRPLFLDEEGLDKEITLRKLAGKIFLGKDHGRWETLSAYGPGRVVLFSSGRWSSDQSVRGRIFVNFPALKLLRWKLSGTWDRVQLQPSARMLKKLARRHPGMKLPVIIEFTRPGKSLVDKVSTGQSVERLKTIGKKVVETARKIIPDELTEREGVMKTSKKTPPASQKNDFHKKKKVQSL